MLVLRSRPDAEDVTPDDVHARLPRDRARRAGAEAAQLADQDRPQRVPPRAREPLAPRGRGRARRGAGRAGGDAAAPRSSARALSPARAEAARGARPARARGPYLRRDRRRRSTSASSAVETLIFRARRAVREQLENALGCDEACAAHRAETIGDADSGACARTRAACAECATLERQARGRKSALRSARVESGPAVVRQGRRRGAHCLGRGDDDRHRPRPPGALAPAALVPGAEPGSGHREREGRAARRPTDGRARQNERARSCTRRGEAVSPAPGRGARHTPARCPGRTRAGASGRCARRDPGRDARCRADRGHAVARSGRPAGHTHAPSADPVARFRPSRSRRSSRRSPTRS